MKKLDFKYDPDTDVLTVEGKQYAGELFRSWAEGGFKHGRVFSMVRDEKIPECICLKDHGIQIEKLIELLKKDGVPS